jgi:hypothetical protein
MAGTLTRSPTKGRKALHDWVAAPLAESSEVRSPALVKISFGKDLGAARSPGLLIVYANFTTTDCQPNLSHVLVSRIAAVEDHFDAEFAEASGGEFGHGRRALAGRATAPELVGLGLSLVLARH